MAELAQPLDTPAPWFLAKTHLRYEQIARVNLEKQGFEVYLPLRLVRDRKGTVSSRALFPRHLFFSVGANAKAWRAVFSTIGVQSVYRSGDHPATVPLDVVNKIRAKEEGDGLIHILDPKAKAELLAGAGYSRGDRLKIRSGPFEGMNAIFAEPVDTNRIAILVKLLGRETRVTLEMGQLT